MKSKCTRKDFLFALSAVGLGGCVGAPGHENALAGGMVRDCVRDGLYLALACASNRGDFFTAGCLSEDGPRRPVTGDSLFDLASVGKTQTAALCALLYAEGRLDVDAPFTEYLPEHVLSKENCRITLRDLATHSGGFDNSKPYGTPDVAKMFRELYRKRPRWSRGARYCYACSNYVYLGLIVERLTGLDLDTAARRMLWGPLGMSRTTWKTVVGNPDVVACSKSTYGGKTLRKPGERNDECAHFAGRPMGNGANFSTAPDMLAFVTDMLRRERFPKAYYDLQLAPSFTGDGRRRSFGWDMKSSRSTFSDWTKTGFSDSAICHTGWTGPAIAVDPARDFAGVVLGSRLASKEKTMGPRMRILDAMASVTS